VNETFRKAAEIQDRAAHVHRQAAEQHGKQDHETGHEQSRQLLEHSSKAYLHSEARQTPPNAHGIAPFGHQDIAALAYQLWIDRGCPEGSPEEDWFHAAEQLRSRR